MATECNHPTSRVVTYIESDGRGYCREVNTWYCNECGALLAQQHGPWYWCGTD